MGRGTRSPSRRRSNSRRRGRTRSRSRGRQNEKRSGGTGSRGGSGEAATSKPTAQKSLRKVRKDIFGAELGYRDESNPFGDTALTDKFVWKKKNEYLQAAGLFQPQKRDEQEEKIRSKIREIQSVKKRRDEREVEKQLLEEQRLQHDAELHDEEYSDWLKKEDEFHLQNAKIRSQIRIEQGRERPIDLVAKGLAIADGEEFEEMTILDKYPYQLFSQMAVVDLQEMMEEIETFIRNDTKHRSFWRSMQLVCQDALDGKQREKSASSMAPGSLSGMGAGVAEGVLPEIHELLGSKSRKELEDMRAEIQASIKTGGDGMDIQFFESVASKIPLYIARVEIEQVHDIARKRSDKWMDEHGQDPSKPPEGAAEAERRADAGGAEADDWDDLPVRGSGEPVDDDGGLSPELEPLSVLDETSAKGVTSQYSPVLEPITAFDPQDLLDPEEDERMLKQVRRMLIESFGGVDEEEEEARTNDDAMLKAERTKGMGKDEVGFNAVCKEGDDSHGEVLLDNKHYEWEEKYRPRKPRFFNRVKTGFEWNKYNQTHYDHDNPPPKMVQGYKFNIFYPDLIDKGKAPKYMLEKGDGPDNVILRFHAGPPYEDCAFKIVNREWNLSHKFGFRCVFDRGVLQLYFNFKRWRYRR